MVSDSVTRRDEAVVVMVMVLAVVVVVLAVVRKEVWRQV